MTTQQIGDHRKEVPAWSIRAKSLRRTFEFKGFLDSVRFVKQIATKAEKLNHHPDIDIRFDKVTLTLTTHDEGVITEKDFALAKQCDAVFAKFFAP
jgi:4a-hydroxytetrahydrobiopterin dehydratase